MYKSLIAQTLHYFARPHEGPRRTPIDGPGAWRGADLATSSAWRYHLSSADIDELDRALAAAKATGRSMTALTRAEFPLPGLAARIDDWRREVATGRGFVLMQGFPVERWGEADASIVFYALGLHLGIPGAQNPEGDLLGHVRDTGADARDVRAYRTASNIAYHCDAADLVGLMCLQPAARGGTSRIVSSISVYNALLAERPELVDRLTIRSCSIRTEKAASTTSRFTRAAMRAANSARSGTPTIFARRTNTSARPRSRRPSARCWMPTTRSHRDPSSI